MTSVRLFNSICGLCGLDLKLNPDLLAGHMHLANPELVQTLYVCQDCYDSGALLPIRSVSDFTAIDLPGYGPKYLKDMAVLKDSLQGQDLKDDVLSLLSYRGFGDRTQTGILIECLNLTYNFDGFEYDYSLLWLKTRAIALYKLLKAKFYVFFENAFKESMPNVLNLFKQGDYFMQVLEHDCYTSLVFALDNLLAIFHSILELIVPIFPFDFSQDLD